jgi:enamine deaminase RidA (YjgF/YER057c/UK114 family)
MARTHKRKYVKGERSQTRSYSPAVITEGGAVIWLAGQTGGEDEAGRSLTGDFEAQVRETFRRLANTLAQAGGTLADLVTMTVFITDSRYGTRFTEIRREILGDDFPGSALITCAGLAQPALLVEVQAIAVVG